MESMNTSELAAITNHLPGLVVMYNIQTGEYLYVNESVKKILGYDADDFLKGGLTFATSLVHPEDLSSIMKKNAAALKRANAAPAAATDLEPIVSFEYRMKHKDGSWRWLYTEGTVFGRNREGQVELVLNISLDITDQKKQKRKLEAATLQSKTLKESEERLRSFIEAVKDYAIFQLDTQGNIMSWNEGIEYILGYKEEDIIGKHINIFFTKEQQAAGLAEEELTEAAAKGSAAREGIRVRKDKTVFYSISTTTAIRDHRGRLRGFSKIMRDVTELKEAEETIRFQALHDTLTGLANRKALDEHFELSQSLARRHKYSLALLFLDLDRFKIINDTLGHSVGDLILKEVAHRLVGSVRQIDTVARLGGDEFIILLNEIHSNQDVAMIADKILEVFNPVMRVQNQSLHVSTTMGIAMFPADGHDIYTLLKNADTALYRAKDAGRGRYQFYNYSMNLESAARLSLEQDLRNALANDQLHLVYQPFVDLKTDEVKGVEALIRWAHPKLGELLPYDFIPLAEETGMIIPIGKWILKHVCQQGKQFEKQGFPLLISVNLSARQFSEVDLVETISENLKQTDHKTSLLELEITESVAMENITRTSSKLNDLKKKGLTIAIDDFGTGYSSLSYLKRFPVHKLKIDKSFIKHAMTDPQDSSIIRAIISMGHSLGLTICAEGVEDEQQKNWLTSEGCDLAQGYLFSKPLAAADLLKWLRLKYP